MIQEKYKKIVKFTDLLVWQKSYDLTLEIYNLTTNFPLEERFALADQMKRAAVSVSSNIAEGFSRQSFKEKVQFYKMSQGSLTELQNQLLIAQGVGLITKECSQSAEAQSEIVLKLLYGLIKATKAKKYEKDTAI